MLDIILNYVAKIWAYGNNRMANTKVHTHRTDIHQGDGKS